MLLFSFNGHVIGLNKFFTPVRFSTVVLLQVFRPQNPWTMAIMNVLAELHQEHDLKVREFL